MLPSLLQMVGPASPSHPTGEITMSPPPDIQDHLVSPPDMQPRLPDLTHPIFYLPALPPPFSSSSISTHSGCLVSSPLPCTYLPHILHFTPHPLYCHQIPLYAPLCFLHLKFPVTISTPPCLPPPHSAANQPPTYLDSSVTCQVLPSYFPHIFLPDVSLLLQS